MLKQDLLMGDLNPRSDRAIPAGDFDVGHESKDVSNKISLKVISEVKKAAKNNPGHVHHMFRKAFAAPITSVVSKPVPFNEDDFTFRNNSCEEPHLKLRFEISKSSIGLVSRRTEYIRLYVDDVTNKLYLEDDQLFTGSFGCSSCFSGEHNPKKVLQDFRKPEVVEAFFNRVDQISCYNNLLASDILTGGCVFGTYTFSLTLVPFLLASHLADTLGEPKAILCLTSPLWAPLTIPFFGLSLALASAIYATTIAVSLVALVLDLMIAKPLTSLSNCAASCFGRSTKIDRVNDFIKDLAAQQDRSVGDDAQFKTASTSSAV